MDGALQGDLLLVEDDPTNRMLVRAVLGRASDARVRESHVTEAPTLAAARAALATGRPTAVMLDVRLPDGNGLDLAREIAAMPAAARPRVVVMSASVLAAERDAAVRAGCDAFLAKPFRPGDLTDLLADWLAS
ncbi:MAG TPA: response regulator [Candidatus Limnocylindrales bacterium]|jgi:CheY-like chemotaxis protein